MAVKRLIAPAALTLFAAVLVAAARPQAGQGVGKLYDNPLEPVPGALRVPLLERLSQEVDYLNASDFGKLYDIMPEECRHGLTKEKWLAEARRVAPGKLLSFSVEEVVDYEGKNPYKDSPAADGEHWWAVKGCAEYGKDSATIKTEAAIFAVRRGGEWLVCGLGRAVAADGSDKPCAK